jgi:hypothetical protein
LQHLPTLVTTLVFLEILETAYEMCHQCATDEIETATVAPGPVLLLKRSFKGYQTIDRLGPVEGNWSMSAPTMKSELRDIAKRIPDSASYNDVMYQLYVRMKIARGKQATDEGRVVPHDEVKCRFAK